MCRIIGDVPVPYFEIQWNGTVISHRKRENQLFQIRSVVLIVAMSRFGGFGVRIVIVITTERYRGGIIMYSVNLYAVSFDGIKHHRGSDRSSICTKKPIQCSAYPVISETLG